MSMFDKAEPHDSVDIEARLRAIEEKLDLVLARLGAGPVASAAGGTSAALAVPDSVLRYIDAGKKIQAIKEYRTLTGAGLREAKLAVDTAEALRGR
jgi:large subunit ribosomal protein L7/L12